MRSIPVGVVPLRLPLARGERSPRVALVGAEGAGKRTLFEAVRSTAPRAREAAYQECAVQVGLDEVRLMHLASFRSPSDAPAALHSADVILQVVDATALERHLELTLALRALSRPMMIALNKMDDARERGMYVSAPALARRLGIPVVPACARMGIGLSAVFRAAIEVARREPSPLPRLEESARQLARAAMRPEHSRHEKGWRYWLDEVFLSPRWNLIGSIAVFAAVLFVVFRLSAWLDSVSAAPLAVWIAGWSPSSTGGIVALAVASGLAGLVGIVVPYMIPLVLLLVALEQAGIMARIAFAVDSGFHRVGLHGGVALPFLLGLGCNVPAISAVARSSAGRERIVASLLVTFVPCSARSAIVLALAGKYLGGLAVLGIFSFALIAIALLGKLLRSRYPAEAPGQIQEIPPYALPRLRALAAETWLRTRDILTIVTPLLVGGSVVLALLQHFGADAWINALASPLTLWWLGLPVALGVPLVFGVLRKELSLLMLYQALGGFELDRYLDPVQLVTLVVFLIFYVPCISTFAVMLKMLGRNVAWASVGLSIGTALALAGMTRVVLSALQALA
jgi:ferrous iron transport protein B